MSKKDIYEQRKPSSRIDKYGTAEEEYITQEHLDAYYEFVKKVKEKFNLKTDKEAEQKAQFLIRERQKKESQKGREM